MGKLLEQRNRALDDINAGRTVKKIRDLESRVRELEEENARLIGRPIPLSTWQKMEQQLAASQLHAEQLREALKRIGYDEACFEASENPSEWPVNVALEALSIPNDTSALDAYVEQKVKEATINDAATPR